ncbi:MAG TPA: DUF47 family protein, partial [Candidatus Xenobia bacterium]
VEAVKGLAEFQDVSPLRDKIHDLEKEGDDINREAIAQLFDGNTAVLDVIKWKEIYESLEDAVDKCEDAFDILEGIVLKHA